MKNSTLISLLASLSLSMPLVWAEEVQHTDKDKKSSTSTPEKNKQTQMEKRQEHLLQMHAQMNKIMDAKTPEERKRHKDEHLRMMKDSAHSVMERDPKSDKKNSDKTDSDMQHMPKSAGNSALRCSLFACRSGTVK